MTAISNQSNQQYIGEVVRKHRDKISLTLAALLLFSIIGRHTAVSSTIALSLISVVYLLTVTLLLFDTDIEIRAERIYLLLF